MKNPYRVDGSVTYVESTLNGNVIEITIDTEDLEKVKSFKNKWHIKDTKNWAKYAYGQTWETKPKKKATHVPIHRFILGAPVGSYVDHINGNGLDNRKCNLRIVSQSDNGLNMKTRKGNYSGMNGVQWYKAASKWRARVMLNYREHHLGYYDTKEEAMDAVRDFRRSRNLYSRSVK